MSLSLSPSYNAIVDRLRTETNRDVYKVMYPDESMLRTSNGVMLPYYIVRVGGPVRAAKGRSITTSRHHVNIVFCTVSCVAADTDALDYIVDEALDLLTGWKPPECGEMVLEGGLQYAEGLSTVKPSKFIKDLAFTYRSNLVLDL